MAGLGKKTFAAGEVLRAADVNGYIMDQAVMTFAGTAARGSAIGTAVSEGMVSYLKDSNLIEVYDGSVWTSVNGLSLIKPGSAAVGSGSYTINPSGSVSFTGATSISLNNIFSSKFDNYRIEIDIPAYSYASSVNTAFRLRASGTDNSSANYRWARLFYATAVGGSEETAGTAFQVSAATAPISSGTIELKAPFKTQKTTYQSHFLSEQANTYAFVITSSGITTVTTSYDGITLYPSSGDFTGTISVYGYSV